MSADKERLRLRLMAAGAVAVGFADAGPVGEGECRRLDEWIRQGKHAGMAWMERHAALRRDPGNVLENVRTVISCAFSYTPRITRNPELPHISRYAYGPDYHLVLRRVIGDILDAEGIAGNCRVCIDSAPISEHYWAEKSGIGFRGDNGALIVPGIGCEVFLAEILTTEAYEPDVPASRECLHCGACRRACPTGALGEDGTIDCRRCISYLTIEHRGDWTDPAARSAMDTDSGRNTIFGCDACVTACPLNNPRGGRTIPGLDPLPEILGFGPESLPDTKGTFRRMFASSPIQRAGLDGILRNLRNLK